MGLLSEAMMLDAVNVFPVPVAEQYLHRLARFEPGEEFGNRLRLIPTGLVFAFELEGEGHEATQE